jgi:hypothetical protein
MEKVTQTGVNPDNVPYIVFEGEMARSERHARRLWIALIIAVMLIVASNVIWLIEWMSYDYVSTETVTVDGQNGIASYIGNDGDINYGENSSKADTLAYQE